jgi:dTDP-4-dehydrorhamnose reductase
MNSSLVWITGAGGLIGNYLVQIAPQFAPRRRVRGLTRAGLDLLDFDAVREAFRSDPPQLIIHCGAISTIAGADADPKLAERVNIEATKLLAELAAESQFIFFSTDLVFDGSKGNYRETDAPNPLHFYAETKVAAEQIVLKNPRHVVVRTSINGGLSPTRDRGFNEKIRREWGAGQRLKLFTDEFRSPIFAGETARAVWELASQNQTGIFHVGGAERLSRWQMGQLLAKRWPDMNAKIEPASTKDFPGARRAPDTSFDISKIQRILSKPLPGLSEWLAANPQEPF